MLRVSLTDAERSAIEQRLRRRNLSVDEHFRLQMLLLGHQGLTAPQIARRLGKHQNTVRKFFKRFAQEGLDGLRSRTSPGAPRHLSEEHLLALEATLDASDRTWTSKQMAAWLAAQREIKVNANYLSGVMRGRGWRYKRTQSSLAHKRPDEQTVAASEQKLAALKKAGWVRVH